MAVAAAVIIAAASHLAVTVSPVEANRMISFAHFEVELFSPFTGRDGREAVNGRVRYFVGAVTNVLESEIPGLPTR